MVTSKVRVSPGCSENPVVGTGGVGPSVIRNASPGFTRRSASSVKRMPVTAPNPSDDADTVTRARTGSSGASGGAAPSNRSMDRPSAAALTTTCLVAVADRPCRLVLVSFTLNVPGRV